MKFVMVLLSFLFMAGTYYAVFGAEFVTEPSLKCVEPDIIAYKTCVDARCGTGYVRPEGCGDICREKLEEEQRIYDECIKSGKVCLKHACQVTLTPDYAGVAADGVSNITFRLVVSGDYEDFCIELRPKSGGALKGKAVDVSATELVFTPDAADKDNNYLEPQIVEAYGWCVPKQADCETGEPEKEYSHKEFSIEQPPVFFVHGIFSNSNIWWIFERKAKEAGWEYDDITYISENNIKNAAKLDHELGEFIEGIKKGNYYDGKRISVSKADIVSHSMGGLVTRYYIGSDYYDNNIRKFIMLGTPNKGSWDANAADWVKILSAGLAVFLVPFDWHEACSQLAPDSDFLNQINLQKLNESIEYRTVAGTGWSTHVGIGKPSTWRGDGVVLVDSVKLPGVPLYCTYDAHSSQIYWAKPGIMTTGDYLEWTTSRGGLLTSSNPAYEIVKSLLLTGTAANVADCEHEFIPKNQFIAWLKSPATLHAYDEKGNHVGIGRDGKLENTIGDGVYYSDNSSEIYGKVIKIVGDRHITFVAKGYDQGDISLEFTRVFADGTIKKDVFENISIDEKTQYSFSISDDNPELIKGELKAEKMNGLYVPLIVVAILAIVFGTILREIKKAKQAGPKHPKNSKNTLVRMFSGR